MYIQHNLVTAYQIISKLGLDDHTYTHLSARADDSSFYIHKFGLRFEEVNLQNLIQVSVSGVILDGNEVYCNKTGHIIHSGIYKNRPDINYIFHLHTPHITAISALKDGLLPINQWALHFYEKIQYHDYNSLALSDDYGYKIATDLSDSMILMMRHHGAVICGQTVQEAMFYAYHLEQACKTQFITLSMNCDYLTIPPIICEKSVKDLLCFEENLGARDWEAWLRFIEKFK